MADTEKKDYRETLREKHELIYATFGPGNPQGQACLKMLEKTFQSGSMLSDSPIRMAYNVGQSELVGYIKELLETATHE